MKQNILLYTDIGDDIDDTLALCYLLEYTQHNIIAIITTGGDTTQRKKEAQHICDIYNVQIPIFAGNSQPIEQDNKPKFIPKLHTIIKAHKDITIASIGPCTDLAASYRHIPEMKERLTQIIYQGDITQDNKPDIIHAYNFRCDPDAALRCAQNIKAPQIYVGKQEAYKHPLTKHDLETFSSKPEVNKLLVNKAEQRFQKFKKLNKEKRLEIYGRNPGVISFPYDLMTVKKIDLV